MRARTLLINSARSLAKGFGVRLPKSITATFGERALADLPAMLRTALEGLLRQIDALSQHIGNYDQRMVSGEAVKRLSRVKPPFNSITSVGLNICTKSSM
jgi:transposase